MAEDENLTGQQMRNLARGIDEVINEGYPKKTFGMCLLVFELGKPGISNYVSTCEREDMITALKETVYRLEGKEDFPTREE